MITIYINQRHVVLRVENYTSLFSSVQKKRKKEKKNGLPFSAEARGIQICRNQAVSLLVRASSGKMKIHLHVLSLIVKYKHWGSRVAYIP